MPKDWTGMLKRMLIPGIILILLCLLAGFRFYQLMEKTREGTTVGHLQDLRQAILLFYQDHNGLFPRELSSNSPFSRYLEKNPGVENLHPRNGVVSPAGNDIAYGTSGPQGFGRGWYYNYESGQIFVNSTGLDSRGISYTAY
jgi:hypothetical protein